MLAECPGVVSRCGGLGRAAHSEKYPGGVLGSGTRDTWRLGRHPEKLSRLWYSGHVATRVTSGETLPAGVLGTRVALAGFRGKYHSLDFAAHSGASGRVA